MNFLNLFKKQWIIAIALVVFGVSFDLHAQVVIKLGTQAPEGSPWHNLLREMGEKWEQMSAGRVKLKIYPGGVAGNDSDMIRKLRVNQLHAALLTGVGIRDIVSHVQALQVPMLLKNDQELDAVLSAVSSDLDKYVGAKGFVSLGWGDAGWVTFFTQKPVHTPDEMKDVKLFAWVGDEASVEAWKIAGFSPVVVSSTDITTSLQTGMLQAVDTTPLIGLSFQWFRYAKYVVDVKWAPMVGGVLMTQKAFDQIPADLKEPLLKEAKRICERLKTESRKLEASALQNLKKEGVEVITLTSEQKATWVKAAEKVYPFIREKVVPADFFDRIVKIRDEFRAKNKQ